jgi:hypothetical protein
MLQGGGEHTAHTALKAAVSAADDGSFAVYSVEGSSDQP